MSSGVGCVRGGFRWRAGGGLLWSPQAALGRPSRRRSLGLTLPPRPPTGPGPAPAWWAGAGRAAVPRRDTERAPGLGRDGLGRVSGGAGSHVHVRALGSAACERWGRRAQAGVGLAEGASVTATTRKRPPRERSGYCSDRRRVPAEGGWVHPRRSRGPRQPPEPWTSMPAPDRHNSATCPVRAGGARRGW
jgi:hypothetical protein